MPTSPKKNVMDRLRRAALLRQRDGVGDGELLGCFLERHDEAALAALIKRHGPMVWGVCRRLLNHHDAEDAFQATFLVLVRKATSIVPREMVGNWLYGVAHQTALQARRTATRRRAREIQVQEMPAVEAVPQDQWSELRPLLDQELSRLPDIYRAVLVLCELEGRTRKEVAGQLRVPEGTVAGRLARARAMLAKRLLAQGITLSTGALALVLAQNVASARVPLSVLSSTISVASGVAAGQAAVELITPQVAALTEGVLKTMLLTKLKSLFPVLLVLIFVATGATILNGRSATAQSERPPVVEKPREAPAKEELQQEEFAWGKEVDGLQLGLALVPANKNVYCTGEAITLEVRVRNVSKAPRKITYWLLFETQPQITTAQGKKVVVTMPPALNFEVVLTEKVIPPGATSTLYRPRVMVAGAQEGNVDWNALLPLPTIRVKPGKYEIAYRGMLDNHPSLSTGTVAFVVKEKDTRALPAKPLREPAQGGFTAWGKEVGGLQAGLGYLPGQKGISHTGETATLVVRVRNVGKKEVAFQYLRQFFIENPPTVVDPNGKAVPLLRVSAMGFHIPAAVKLPPGGEMQLYKWEVELRPASESNQRHFSALYGTGKFRIQYERILGNSSAGSVKNDPALNNLATGKLDLEVTADAPPATSEPNEDQVLAFTKTFLVAMRTHHGDRNGNAIREYFDPHYLKKYHLLDRDLAVQMAPIGNIWNYEVADDRRTILCLVETQATPNAPVKEALLLRVAVHEGKLYVSPVKAPDPKTGSFTPWILRTKR